MIIIYVVISTVGAIGACVGSYIGGGPIISVRLYGLVIFDSIALLLLSRAMNIDIGKMGDFISVPIMVVCASSKISCWITGCCYGFVIGETQAGELVRFPSVLFEMLLWIITTAFLILLEKRGNSKNMLWAIAAIWFGILRFIASFFRGPGSEFTQVLPGISGGKLWSLVTLIIGLFYLYFFLKRNLNRNPKPIEFVKAIVGA